MLLSLYGAPRQQESSQNPLLDRMLDHLGDYNQPKLALFILQINSESNALGLVITIRQ